MSRKATNKIKQLICDNCNTILDNGERKCIFKFCSRSCSEYHRLFNINRKHNSKKYFKKTIRFKNCQRDDYGFIELLFKNVQPKI